LSLNFEQVSFESIRGEVRAHVNALPGRIDSFVEEHISTSNHFLLRSDGELAGFASIQEGGLITQFAMKPAFRHQGGSAYAQLKRMEHVRSAYVPTCDDFFLAHALDEYREVKKQAYLFKLGPTSVEPQPFVLHPAATADLDRIVQESGDFFDNVEQQIRAENLFVTTLDGEPVGFGVIEQSDLYDRVASIGMFTTERFRGQGVGAATIRGLIRVTQSRGLEPIAGCWYFNHRSKKTLERAGMHAASRLLRFEY